MRNYLLIIILVFISKIGNAQDTTFVLYFKSGQSVLNNQQIININKIQNKPIAKVRFEGYADTVGKMKPNLKLSKKRAETVATYFKTSNNEIFGYGETKNKKIPLHKMRRVVVKVWYEKLIVKPQEIKKEIVESVKIISQKVIDPCTDDTTIYSPSGSKMIINRCFYLNCKAQGCFKYEEFLTARSVQRAGLQTVDEQNNPIESGGMINIQFCSDSCLKKPVIIYLPVPPCLTKEQMTMWTLSRSNRWINSNKKIEFITIDGKVYYKLEVFCPGKINCDRIKRRERSMKVKLKNGLKFKSASLSSDCPLGSIEGKIKRRKKVVKFPYRCPKSEPIIYIKAYNKNGDTLIIDNLNLNDYTRKRKLFSKCVCEKPKERYLGIFKIRQKLLYGKYKVFKTDFKDSESSPKIN